MCLNKTTIRNRRAPWKASEYDKYLLEVPCGSCPDCCKTKANDLLVRTYFEFTRNDFNSAFFVTLDFDDDHLPKYNNIPCFDSEVIKHFFHRLRYYTGSFRYLYVTEYGSGLGRPHYHVIFLFDKELSKPFFFNSVRKSWLQGSHSDIEKLRSVRCSLLKALSYITGYASKDLSFNFNPAVKDFPIRYKPRCQPSNKWGYAALEEGFITFDMLKDNLPVYIPIGKNGTNLPFKIPRYYELQFTHYHVYYPKFKRTEWFKTEQGEELAKIRHNANYEYLFDSLVSSLPLDLHNLNCYKKFKELYPSSPYSSMSWTSILSDCLSDIGNFQEFLYISPFLERKLDFSLKSCDGQFIDWRYKDMDWQDHLVGDSSWYRFNECLHLYKLYQAEISYTDNLIKSYDRVNESKKRLLNKCLLHPEYRNYLNRKSFDWSKLLETDFLSFETDFSQHHSLVNIYRPRRLSRFRDRSFIDYRVNLYMSNLN